jgi:hypothetical protein
VTHAGVISSASRLRSQRNGPRSGESLRQTGEHYKVGVKADTFQATDAKRGHSVVVLQATELALDRDAALVEALEARSVATDAREQATAEREREGNLVGLRTPERDDQARPLVLRPRRVKTTPLLPRKSEPSASW